MNIYEMSFEKVIKEPLNSIFERCIHKTNVADLWPLYTTMPNSRKVTLILQALFLRITQHIDSKTKQMHVCVSSSLKLIKTMTDMCRFELNAPDRQNYGLQITCTVTS